MKEKIKNTQIAKNLTLSTFAQIVSIVVSFVMGFIVPKFIDEYQYSYWQTYFLYAGYSGILNLGVFYGMVLRYSQYDYDELDKPTIRSQFQILSVFFAVVCAIGCIASIFVASEQYRLIIILVSVGIIVKNFYIYASYTMQMTNRINLYAILIIVDRLIYALVVIVLLFCGVNDFYWYCIADLLSTLLASLLVVIFSKELYFGKCIPLRKTLSNIKINISAGFFLLIASYAANFLVGGAKMVVQWHWDTLVFGKVSFAFSVTNTFLSFVTAIGVVLFPSLKRMNEEELPSLYGQIRNAISPLLFLALLLYFPVCWVLEIWLPSYSESLVYLGVLLPIIVFSSKVNLLTNNYLKAYRKEKIMFIINIVSVVIGFGLALFFAYVVENLDLLLYSVVLITMLCSIVSEVVVTKIIHKKIWFDFIVELIMTIIFIVVARYLSLWWGCLAYAVALVIYFVLYRKNIVTMLRSIKDVINKRKKSKTAMTDNQTEIKDNKDE